MIPNSVNWSPGITLEEMEKQCILAAFRFYRGNKTTTAQVLGIAIRTLDNKLEKYNADNKRESDRVEAAREQRHAELDRQRGRTITQFNALGSAHQIEAPGQGTATGVHVQPTSDVAEEHAVSLPERREVQAVLSKQSAGSGQSRRR